ncbi:MAG: branched-chain amino acid transport system permease protein [Actinomycetota bacterium]|nr:branched-chain amino acid transport system permease protein [Actinomycetota bacterium]
MSTRTRSVTLALAAAAAIAWPFFTSKTIHFYGALSAIYALVALSLVILAGWTGQVSLGHAAFLGFGVYIGQKVLNAGVPVLPAILIVAAFGAVISLALGVPSLRLRGVYLTIVTLAFGAACQHYFFQLKTLRTYHSTTVPRPSVFGFSMQNDRALYFLVLVVFSVALFVAWNLRRSDTGRALFAIRDSEEAAQALAIRIAPYKIGAFALSAALATTAGLFYGMLYGATPGPDQFGILQSFFLLALPVVGGLESLAGAVLGGAFLATAQPLVNLFGIRLFLASSVALILVALSPYDGVTGMASALVRSVRDAFGTTSRVRYGSFVPEEPVIANGHARATAVLRGEIVTGSRLRLRVRGSHS